MQSGWMLSCAVTALAAGCHTQLESHRHVHEHTTVVVADSGTYAAMDELPVTGGELRLVVPIDIEIDLEVEVGEVGRAIGFPLVRTDVDADVSAGVAVYEVEQLFDNPYEDPIEAVYVFPLGAASAVVGYEIVIGDRTVTGEIKPRKEARRVYEQARRDGHTAALLEQDKPNVFSQRVANIPPGQQVRVRLQYVEMLDYADGNYQLVFPMVVGPRYLPAERLGRRPVGAHRAGEAGRPGVTSIAYADAAVLGSTVSFRATLDAGMPIAGVTSPSHEFEVERISETAVRFVLADRETVPNRDLIARFATAGERTLVGLATHREGDGAGYFTLVVQPKQAYGVEDIVPREVIILIDVSGSMAGTPFSQAQAVARALIATVSERDRFNVIAFASGTASMAPRPIAGDAAGRAAGTAWVDGLRAGGGTEMERAILTSLAAGSGGERLQVVYVLTDGYIGNDEVILDAAARALGQSRIFPVGVGSSVNRHLIDRLAEVGRGAASYIAPGEQPGPVAAELVRRSAYPYLTDLAVDWAGLRVTDLTPSALPDVHAGTPLVLAGRYLAPGEGRVQITATAAGRRVMIPLEVALPTRADRPAVRHAWARKRVAELTSTASRRATGERAVEEQVTAIGLEHRMVTEYTSFVAVDRARVVDRAGNARTVVQPAATPAGVNLDTAIGPAPAPAAPDRSYRGSGGGRSSGGRWGGGGGGGGDVDPLTLLLLALMLPAAVALRRSRAP